MTQTIAVHPTGDAGIAPVQAGRSIPLDCIRAFAILGVVVFHVATRYDTATLDPVARWFRQFGLLGVDVFFPLSGYLITGFLTRPGPVRIRTFFLRRFFRIVPLYMLAVAIYAAASIATGYQTELLSNIWITFTFLTGWAIYFVGEDPIPYTITWSLSVEVFAYILFGILAWWRPHRFVALLIGAVIFSTVLRWYILAYGNGEVYHFPLARLDSLALGGLTAVAVQRGTPWLAAALAVATAVTVALALQSPLLWAMLKYSFITLGTCLLITLAETRYLQANWRPLWPLASIGFYSYFTYLFHFFVIYALFVVTGDAGLPFWVMAAAALALTHVAALISFKLFEKPLARYGRSLERR